MDPFIGEIRAFGFNYDPLGWDLCDGHTLPINMYEPLFALLGTTYGGDGVKTFAVPDLRGCAPIGMGTGPGLTTRDIGDRPGVESVSLIQNQMPAHNHPQNCSNAEAITSSPKGNIEANNSTRGTPARFNTAVQPLDIMHMNSIGIAGSGLPHDNMPPSLVINWCIATQGIYPSRK